MMAVILIVGLFLGWRARRASTQRRAVAAVLALGGKVLYEDQIDSRGRPSLPRRHWGPRWFRQFLGDEYFQEVAWVTIDAQRRTHRVNDRSIAVIDDFDHLQGLSIFGPGHQVGEKPTQLITEAGLARLNSLSRLRWLTLHNTGCDDAMIGLLPRSSYLESLSIIDHPGTIRGSSLAQLAKLNRLKRVEIFAIESSMEGDLTPLAGSSRIEELRITRSPSSDRGVADFGEVSTLKSIELPDTTFSLATLQALCRNPGLQSLSFDGSQLPQGAFQSLAGLKQLVELSVCLDGKADQSNVGHLIHRVARKFGDADLDALQSVPLKSLSIMGMDATDAGVGRLLRSHKFTSLTLSGRGMTDASIPELVQQTQLQILVLADTGLTDAGLARLSALARLRTLSLVDNAAITDEGVTPLQAFPSLNYLTIRQPAVKPATLDAIRVARSKFGPFNLFQPPDEADHSNGL